MQLQRNDFLAFQLSFFPGRWGLPGSSVVWVLYGNSGEFPTTGFSISNSRFCFISLASMLWWDCSEAAAGHCVSEVLADRHYTDAAHGRAASVSKLPHRHLDRAMSTYILCSKLRDIKAHSTVEQNFLAS